MNIQTLLTIVEKLPLPAVEQVYAFLNSRPHKVEGRPPTPEEVQTMATDLLALVERLQEEYPEENELHPDIERLERMSKRK